jgi:hypothetical protein
MKNLALLKIFGATVFAQLVMVLMGASMFDATVTTSFLTAIAPLYSAKVQALYRLAFGPHLDAAG